MVRQAPSGFFTVSVFGVATQNVSSRECCHTGKLQVNDSLEHRDVKESRSFVRVRKVPKLLHIILKLNPWRLVTMIRKVVGVAVALSVLGMVSTAWATPVGFTVRGSDQALIAIDLTTFAISVVGATGGSDIDGLAFNSFGMLFASDNSDDVLRRLSPMTGATSTSVAFNGAVTSVSDSGLAFDSSNMLYISDDSGGSGTASLYTVNAATAALSLLGVHGADIDAIAFDGSDVLYGIDDTNDELVTLNTTTGAIASVTGSLGIATSSEQGLSFDSNGNLWLMNEGDQSLYTLNLSTGAATFQADLGDDFESLAIIDVPEPSSLTLLGVGIGMMGLAGWRRRRRTQSLNR